MKLKTSLFALLYMLIILTATANCATDVNGLDKSEWLTRLNAIAPGDWRSARGEVAPLGGLPPDKVARFVVEIWPSLTVAVVKEEILNTLSNVQNPRTLRIVKLAADDKSPQVVERAKGHLYSEFALDVNKDWDKTRHWLDAHQNQSYTDLRRTRVREIVGQVRYIGKLAQPDRDLFLRQANMLFRSPELRDTILKSGLFTVLQDVLRDPGLTPNVQVSILRFLITDAPSGAFLRDAVWPMAHASERLVRIQALEILGKSRYRPAYDLIKAALVQELQEESPDYSSLAPALGSYGDPEAIPFLIGLIAADNVQTVYDVGYHALGQQLTGAPYGSTHDGNWWRIWWERNRAQLPAGVRDLPIPDFAHSRAYKEPLPKEVHLEPALMRKFLLQEFTASIRRGEQPNSIPAVQKISEIGDPAAIPAFIGAIAADNTLDAVYRYGYYGLDPLTGVKYNILHDGAWWKLWWEEHRKELPSEIRDLPIPDFAHAKEYEDPIPAEVHRSPDAMRTELLTKLRNSIAGAPGGELYGLCHAITDLNDPRIVPDVIDMIPEDPKSGNIYWLTYFGIGPLTGVAYAEGRGRAWWQDWWRQNETEFKKKYVDAPKQPDFVMDSYKPNQQRIVPPVTEIGYDPKVKPPGAPDQADLDADDIKDISSERFFAKGDKNRFYRLVGYSKDQPVPRAGYKLLVVLPGGDGSEEFRWFVRRMKKYALPANVLIAELVAPKWSSWQANSVVWPTRPSPFYGMKFTTEQFIDDVISDVRKRIPIDGANVCTLAWSSSGPAVYTYAATKKTAIRGAFIAMSVFRPGELPDPSALKGRRFFIYHSPQDFIKIQQAKDAVDYLTSHGAYVKLQEYQGGHGWTGDVYGGIQQGVAWLFAEN